MPVDRRRRGARISALRSRHPEPLFIDRSGSGIIGDSAAVSNTDGWARSAAWSSSEQKNAPSVSARRRDLSVFDHPVAFESNGRVDDESEAPTRFTDSFPVSGNHRLARLLKLHGGRRRCGAGNGIRCCQRLAKRRSSRPISSQLELGWVSQQTTGRQTIRPLRKTKCDLRQNSFTERYELNDPGNDWVDLHSTRPTARGRHGPTNLVDVQQYSPRSPAQPINIPAASRTELRNRYLTVRHLEHVSFRHRPGRS